MILSGVRRWGAVMALFSSAVLADGGIASAEDFLQGKPITMYISGSPGGGYDLYARTLIEHMGKHLPGNPRFVAKNVPGAGGIALANFMYEQAPKDGSEIAAIHPISVMQAVGGNQSVRYKPTEFGWLGSITRDTLVCIAWHTTGIQKFAEVQAKELLMGAVTGTPIQITPRLLNEIAGAKFKIITGYPSTRAISLAIERQEVGGTCNGYGTIQSSMADAVRDKKLSILIQVGSKKHPEMSNVPFVYDFVKDPADLELLDYEMGHLLFARPFIAPPGVPAHRFRILRDAFWATMQDRGFLEVAAKRQLEVLPVSGSEVEAVIAKLERTSPAVIKRSVSISR